jgi:hypothetical protein
MRKLTLWASIAALLIGLNPSLLKAAGDVNQPSVEPAITELEMIDQTETSNVLALSEVELAMVTTAEADLANAQISRLNEINEMDMSAMNNAEKRELRKEVRAIEKQQNGGGIYISVGAAILIVLLLILLL